MRRPIFYNSIFQYVLLLYNEDFKKMFLPFLIIFARSFFGLFLLLQLVWIITVLVRNSGLWNRKGRSENIHTLREKMLLVNQSVSIINQLRYFRFLPLRYRRNIFRFPLIYLIKNHRFNQFSCKVAQNAQ